MPPGVAWLIMFVQFSCPWALDRMPTALKPLVCVPELKVVVVASKEESQHVLGKMPENPDFSWVFKVDKGRITPKRIRRVPIVDP